MTTARTLIGYLFAGAVLGICLAIGGTLVYYSGVLIWALITAVPSWAFPVGIIIGEVIALAAFANEDRRRPDLRVVPGERHGPTGDDTFTAGAGHNPDAPWPTYDPFTDR